MKDQLFHVGCLFREFGGPRVGQRQANSPCQISTLREAIQSCNTKREAYIERGFGSAAVPKVEG